MSLRNLIGYLWVILCVPVYGQLPDLPFSDSLTSAPRLSEAEWVDSLMQKMSIEEKIGQVFMVAVFPKQGATHLKDLQNLLQNYHIGGLLMMQAEASQQADLVREFQTRTHIPLLVAQDAEWGLNMRLTGSMGFPKALTLGAIRNDSLLYQMGLVMGGQLKEVGVNVNFAPVLDINSHAENSVMNFRSFGENKYNVARKGILFAKGLQDHGVLACAKHFPGHGDTQTDSHIELPIISHSKSRLDTLELYPFTKAIEEGIASVMVGHLHIPALDPTPNLPASLSPKIVKGLLRDSLGYQGLIFTDALNMKAITRYHSPGELDLKALIAGNDILLYPQNISQAFKLIKGALRSNRFSLHELNQKVRRILRNKYQLGLDSLRYQTPDSSWRNMLDIEVQVLRKKLYEAALTLVRNEQNMIPLQLLSYRKIAYVQVGGNSHNGLDLNLRKYTAVETFYLRKTFSAGERKQLLDRLKEGGYNTIIWGIYEMSQRPSEAYGLRSEMIALGNDLNALSAEVVACVFGNPYSLKYIPLQDAILVAYEDDPEAERATAAAIFGGIPISGRLPISASADFPEGTGIRIAAPIRYGFAYPEEEGLDSEAMAKIDSISLHYIDRGAMPGCAIMVLKGNNIVYEKGFGFTATAKQGEEVDPYLHTYDLASVTKITATTISIMQLVEQGWLDLDAPIERYLPEVRNTDKARLSIRRLLQHNAGLPGWKPFYLYTFQDESYQQLDERFCSFEPTQTHTQQIAPNLYIDPSLKDTIWQQIFDLEVRNTRRVRYSDIGMMLLGRIVASTSGISLENYSQNLLYKPLGMDKTMFNPAKKGKAEFCPPATNDKFWRQSIIQGYVHDETAAMMGGQAGHAGLFSNIYDLAKLMLMLKNGGVYGNDQFLTEQTIKTFTRRQMRSNRKGLGWDKPEVRESRSNPVSRHASAATYGHTGFTGTSVWVDPTYDIVYIFLSNRTYPNANNRLLQRENVRVLIMDQIYEAMFSYQRKNMAGP